MRLLRRLDARDRRGAAYAATIGGYDGLHRGHRALIERTRALARTQGLSSLLVTFEPLPREYFAPQDPPARLTSFRERWRLLSSDDLNAMCVLRFCEQLRNLHAADFARLLVDAGVRVLVIGHDFRAARDGYATAEWFEREGPNLGLTVEVLPPVCEGALRISSRAVREALGRGDLDAAAGLLGRRYGMCGRVIAGERLGRKLGFPTANLRLGRRRSPLNGIFAVHVGVLEQGTPPARYLPGVASLGTRPTVGGTRPLLEAHVFDFEGDLYGREIEVQFVARLRDELKFGSLEAMVEQMHVDARMARQALARAS